MDIVIMSMVNFSEKVLRAVSRIPVGRVVSYGQVAAEAGSPRAARQAGRVLRDRGSGVPWWRVINSEGRISIKNNWESTPEEQKRLLLSEGVEVSPEYSVDFSRFRHVFK